MQSDLITLHKLWSETDGRLDSLTRQVREGLAVDEASNFARWLRFSHVIQILQPFDQQVPLPIRPYELQRKMEELIYQCGEWYRLHEKSFRPRDSYVSQSKLEAIEAQLSAMNKQLEALSMPRTEASPLQLVKEVA